YINQQYNESVESYNVIGTIPGEDTSKTFIISSLYDSWWDQGTADSAIGMGMLLAIAKYFKDNDITPKYNLKFIAFGGEEYGYLGAYSYQSRHSSETIAGVVDLNQIGFTQNDPPLKMNLCSNKFLLKYMLNTIAEKSDYVEASNIDLNTWFMPLGSPSNDKPFAIDRMFLPRCRTVGFIKDTGWHTEGDVMKYFDWTDVNATTDLVYNTTKYLAVDPECGFSHIDHEVFDSPDYIDYNTDPDAVNITYTLHTNLPQDQVTVKAITGSAMNKPTRSPPGKASPTASSYASRHTLPQAIITFVYISSIPQVKSFLIPWMVLD
ncbi:MAG: M28 family peptidase, partial [Euryarchaeota archaeon]|nr:M28 family peptidase [Euryarchaeota archaeon]